MTGSAWRGVFPAVTTQFRDDFSLDLDATRRVAAALIDDGVNGLIAVGSVGENSTLSPTEKREIVAVIVDAAAKRVPVLAGVAEITTEQARAFVRDVAGLDADGAMVMSPMIYNAQPSERLAWFTAIAGASDLPLMLYNNPPAYRNDITPEEAKSLAAIDTIVAIKESSGDTRRFVDLYRMVGDRFALFCGLDDVVLECLALGAVGWVSGLSNVFPRECGRLFEAGLTGDRAEALKLYRWIMPLLHLDARPDLVQCIKTCEAIAGRGSDLTRPPRLRLEGAARAEIDALMADAMAHRP